MKSFLFSKTILINAVVLAGTGMTVMLEVFPAAWGGYITASAVAVNMALRFFTKGAISVTLPDSAPAIPPVLQAAMNAFQSVVESLPADLGPRAFELVTQAATGNFPDGTARMNFVLNSLESQFPGVGASVLRGIIEQLVCATQETPAAPACQVCTDGKPFVGV